MADFVAVTDEDLARARRDPRFKHKLLAEGLDRLLRELNKLKRAGAAANPKQARQIREGVELAVKLADRIRALA